MDLGHFAWLAPRTATTVLRLRACFVQQASECHQLAAFLRVLPALTSKTAIVLAIHVTRAANRALATVPRSARAAQLDRLS